MLRLRKLRVVVLRIVEEKFRVVWMISGVM